MPGPVSQVILDNAPVFRDRVLTELYATHPETRLWFPAHADDAHQNLVFALTYLLDNDPDEALVENLAREHRAFGLTPEIAESGFGIIGRAIHALAADLPYEDVHAADQRLSWMLAVMTRALIEAGEPACGTVVDVQRRCRRVTVVRLECPVRPIYLPGQYLGVSSPHIQGYWPHLAPAIPANEGGFIEFHLFDIPELQGLAVSQPGDQWFFGPAHGNMAVTGKRDVLMIAQNTGLAALKSILLSMLSSGNTHRTHLYVGADYPGELYDLASLWQIAATSPWLAVTPVSLHAADEWWVAGTEHSRPPRGLHVRQEGTLNDVITQYGSWGDRDVLIAGSPEWADSMRESMIQAGCPADQIQVCKL
ncbi:2-polyprenylphenol hydroxylase [Corynebacterium sp. H130]|uniref:2-polyprenylphenol hydroxylase n=1 Tax=Corynebacterium sp. H130 TaxID=3133444 RepID=UPI0030AA471E